MSALFFGVLLCVLAPAAVAQEGELERLEAWPELADAARVKQDVARLRKARTDEMASQAHAALVADGAMVAPLLFAALAKEEDAGARERLSSVLDAVVDARHTRLLAREFEARSPLVRAYCLRRAAAFPDAGIRAPAEQALARTAGAEKADERRERVLAALCVTSTGSIGALEVLAECAASEWKTWGADVRTVLEEVRGPEAARVAAAGLPGERVRELAALRLLAGCGDTASKSRVRPYLDSSDRELQLAAINALRGIVDGELPLEQLPVFEMIEVAEAWKKRL
jgi:hypothetical protein